MEILKIAIDLAHGFPKDHGNIGIISEEELINEVGIYLIRELKSLGHEVMLLRPSRNSKNDSLTERGLLKLRVKKCNEFDSDIAISLHGNIGKGIGSEIYTYKGIMHKEAVTILDNLSILGFNNRGIKNGSEIYFVKGVKARALVVCVCFLDTLYDVNNYYSVGPAAIGKAIAYGILGHKKPKEELSDEKDNITWIESLKNQITIQGYADISDLDLEPEEIIYYAPDISFGAIGSITKLIQKKLNINCDGIFGNETRNAVVEFQKLNNLKIDGIVGSDTWTSLYYN